MSKSNIPGKKNPTGMEVNLRKSKEKAMYMVHIGRYVAMVHDVSGGYWIHFTSVCLKIGTTVIFDKFLDPLKPP